MQNSLGVLDGSGMATTTFGFPPDWGPVLPFVGLTLFHATLVVDPISFIRILATNAEPVVILP